MHRRFVYIIVLGVAFMLAPFAIDLYLPAFPVMVESFGTNIDRIEATVAIFLFGFALSSNNYHLGFLSRHLFE